MATLLAALTKGSVEADVKPAVCSWDFSFQRQSEAEHVLFWTKRKDTGFQRNKFLPCFMASREAAE